MMSSESMPPRMRTVWTVLERAKDCNDASVIGACRRLITADRIGWARHHDPADWALVRAVESE